MRFLTLDLHFLVATGARCLWDGQSWVDRVMGIRIVLALVGFAGWAIAIWAQIGDPVVPRCRPRCSSPRKPKCPANRTTAYCGSLR